MVCSAFNQDEDAYDVADRGLIRQYDGFGQQTFGVRVPYGLFLIYGTFIGVTLLTPRITIQAWINIMLIIYILMEVLDFTRLVYVAFTFRRTSHAPLRVELTICIHLCYLHIIWYRLNIEELTALGFPGERDPPSHSVTNRCR